MWFPRRDGLRLVLLALVGIAVIGLRPAPSVSVARSNILKPLKSSIVERDSVLSNPLVELDDELIPGSVKVSGARNFAPALVLNADYAPLSITPLSVWNWQDTLRAVFSDKALVVSEYTIPIRSVSTTVNLPSVIVLKKYYKRPDSYLAALTRRHVYLRDDFKCQVSTCSTPCRTLMAYSKCHAPILPAVVLS